MERIFKDNPENTRIQSQICMALYKNLKLEIMLDTGSLHMVSYAQGRKTGNLTKAEINYSTFSLGINKLSTYSEAEKEE